MRDEDICQFVLDLCRNEGATDASVMVMENEEKMIRFSNNQITVIKDLDETSASIFVQIKERKVGINVYDLSRRKLKAAVKRAVETAAKSQPGDIYAPLPKGPFKYDDRLMNQREILLDSEELVGSVQEAVDAALKEGGKRIAGSLIGRNVQVTIMTSGDVFARTKKSTLELSVRAFVNEHASGHSLSIASKPEDFDPKSAGAEAGTLAKLSSNPVQGTPGKFTAILGPMVFADLANQIGRFASAFYVDAGISFLGDKIGEKIASEVVSISDDPSAAGTYGAFPFDAEGLPTKRTPILEKGVLKNYLHNSTTAKKFNTESTANAGLIVPHPFNLIVEPCNSSVEKMINSIDDGLYLTNNWYLRYQNYKTGDFSTIPRDAMFLIRKGEIERAVRELRISDNILRILKNVKELSRERKWVKWWEVDVPTLTPAVLVEQVNFTKSTN
ncbi:MAG: TldD/PmbA family protein [Methanomassiliicoccales archaeon]|jgi:PmbA protein|nr:TldD/PmbA family protein [Methanomassiliicoccales archaeon]